VARFRTVHSYCTWTAVEGCCIVNLEDKSICIAYMSAKGSTTANGAELCCAKSLPLLSFLLILMFSYCSLLWNTTHKYSDKHTHLFQSFRSYCDQTLKEGYGKLHETSVSHEMAIGMGWIRYSPRLLDFSVIRGSDMAMYVAKVA